MTIRVVGPRTKCDRERTINTTSSSKTWSKGLSPFILGPVPLYEGAPTPFSKTMENGWQAAKLYPIHGDENGPFPEYFEWARKIWESPRAQRYPMGKGATPLYSWWGGERLSYIEARRKIYFPLYAKAVVNTMAFYKLRELYKKERKLTLWDYDGWDHRVAGYTTIKEVVDNPHRKMGHAFVLAHLLEKMHPEFQERPAKPQEPQLSFIESLKIF